MQEDLCGASDGVLSAQLSLAVSADQSALLEFQKAAVRWKRKQWVFGNRLYDSKGETGFEGRGGSSHRG